MVTAVDTSVMLDVLLNDPQHANASLAALQRAAVEGSLVISDAALAEIVPILRSGEIPQFLADWNVTFVASAPAVAVLAGELFRTFLQRGGKRGRVVPDFMIAAHAQELADRLLARNRAYYRDYFRGVQLWDPTAPLV